MVISVIKLFQGPAKPNDNVVSKHLLIHPFESPTLAASKLSLLITCLNYLSSLVLFIISTTLY